jgi:hypothetical protein
MAVGDHWEKAAITGWSKSDKLLPGTTDTIQMQVQFPKAGYYTVQFRAVLPQGTIPDRIFILADVIWTVAGNAIPRTISVANGTTISGMGESVTVIVRDVSDPAEAVNGKYDISMSVAGGSRPGTSVQPIYGINMNDAFPDKRGIVPVATMVGGEVVDFTFPQDIGANSLYLAVSPGAFTTTEQDVIDFVDVTWRSIVLGSLSYNQFNTWIPLPPGVSGLQVTVDAASAFGKFYNIQPILGIEG